jgi:hypothetical protein
MHRAVEIGLVIAPSGETYVDVSEIVVMYNRREETFPRPHKTALLNDDKTIQSAVCIAAKACETVDANEFDVRIGNAAAFSEEYMGFLYHKGRASWIGVRVLSATHCIACDSTATTTPYTKRTISEVQDIIRGLSENFAVILVSKTTERKTLRSILLVDNISYYYESEAELFTTTDKSRIPGLLHTMHSLFALIASEKGVSRQIEDFVREKSSDEITKLALTGVPNKDDILMKLHASRFSDAFTTRVRKEIEHCSSTYPSPK